MRVRTAKGDAMMHAWDYYSLPLRQVSLTHFGWQVVSSRGAAGTKQVGCWAPHMAANTVHTE